MAILDIVAQRLQEPGCVQVTCKPSGTSMTPLIMPGDKVTLVPCANPAALKKGDVVLARVRGRIVLHLVTAVDHEQHRVQIGNAHGRINGWTSYEKVYGWKVPA